MGIVAKNHPEKEQQKRILYGVLTLYVLPGITGIFIDGPHIATSTMSLLPTSRGAVSIRSGNPDDSFRIELSYFSTPPDRDALAHATRQTLKAIPGTKSLGSIIRCGSLSSGNRLEDLTLCAANSSNEAIERIIRSTGMQHHHSGGIAAMGRVVDGEGKVLCVNRLGIANTSIIAIPLGGYPQAALYDMGKHLAGMVMRDA